MHESGENYLETILVLENRNGSVRSIDIANELDYTNLAGGFRTDAQNGFQKTGEQQMPLIDRLGLGASGFGEQNLKDNLGAGAGTASALLFLPLYVSAG